MTSLTLLLREVTDTMDSFFTNVFLWVPLFSGFLAQLIKFFWYFYRERQPDFRWLFLTGGMPSAHASSVTTLSTIVGIKEGFGSLIFGITFFFSLVVMYDAAGLRRAAGMQAAVINRMLKELQLEGRVSEGRLRELLGHTPLEVLAGSALGVFIGVVFA